MQKETDDPMQVGTLGVGRMGRHMAARLAAAGFRVTAHDPRDDVMAGLADIDVTPARTAEEVARRCTHTILMVMDAPQAEEALWSREGFAAGARCDGAGTLIVMSSLPASYVAELGERLDGAVAVVDAPVSGGVEGAEHGTLTIMASGEPQRLDEVTPLLKVLGRRIYRVGDRAGMGSALKSINQSMFLSSLVSSAEMLITGVQAGLDPELIVEVVSRSSGDSWALRNRLPLAWRNNYESGGSLDLMVKDIGHALELAGRAHVEAHVTRAVAARVQDAYARHSGQGDDPLIVETIERESGAHLSAET